MKFSKALNIKLNSVNNFENKLESVNSINHFENDLNAVKNVETISFNDNVNAVYNQQNLIGQSYPVENYNLDNYQENTHNQFSFITEWELRKMNLDLEGLSTIIGYDLARMNMIESISRCGPNNENRKVRIKTYNLETKDYEITEYLLVNKNGEYMLSSISKNGFTMYCDIDDVDKQRIRDMIGLDENVEIRGRSYLKIGDYTVPIYWVGDLNSIFCMQCLEAVNGAINKYPENVVEFIFKNADFCGFFIGDLKSSPAKIDSFNSETKSMWAAYAYLDEYIYMNGVWIDSDCSEIFHEFAHILDRVLGQESYFSMNDEVMLKFYDDYKKIIQSLDEIHYESNSYPDGIPNVLEFFAQSVTIYLMNPTEFALLLPDLYNYIDSLLSNVS